MRTLTAPLALCYGTRPQVIKASVLRRELARQGPVITVDTGQHYDFALNGLLYQQLEVAPPDHFLEVGSGSHAAQTAAILMRMETLIQEHRPRAMIVIGDTNSTLGSALAAGKAGIPVAHVEAGLRAEDARMPEEINRRLVDAIGTLLCTPSPSATARLKRERADARVEQTGDVALDVLSGAANRIPDPRALLPAHIEREYVFATLHRAELTADHQTLLAVLRALGGLDLPVVLALHPRTRAVLSDAGETRTRIGGLSIIDPVGYLESLALCRGAAAVVTDSGGVQREAYWLGVPCVTLRRETEWVETVELGANRLVFPSAVTEDLARAVDDQVRRWKSSPGWNREIYGTGDAATRVMASIQQWLPGGV